MYLVTAAEMREMDRRTIETFGVPGRILMENAGRGAVGIMQAAFPGIHSQRVGVLAGRGNNGGDGFVIARYLACMGAMVTVFLLAEKSRVRGDAGANLALLDPLGVPVYEIKDTAALRKKKPALRRQEVWVDALLGTGLNADVRGHYREAIDFVNRQGKPVLAVDVPSGLNADSGQICGTCIQAEVTATFAFAKIGCAVFPGAACCGSVETVDIGIPPFIVAAVNPRQSQVTAASLRPLIVKRSPDAHKGTTGHLMVIAGSPGKTGAAAMSAMAAMRAGAGLVTLGTPRGIHAGLEPQVTEAMSVPLPETRDGLLDSAAFGVVKDLLPGKRCVAFGPGIGTGDQVGRFLAQLIRNSRIPLVIDADGINLLAEKADILRKARAAVTITPHPGEMARLLGTTAAAVQKDRVGCARDFAGRYRVHVVLKGAATVIAHPDGSVQVNTTGNPGMASGGMGDVLTGLIAGFVTQGYSAAVAAQLGVYLHGRAADHLAAVRGPMGYLATEVMDRIPDEIGRLWNFG